MAKVLVRQPRSLHCAGVRLLPGKQGNEVSDAQLAKLKADTQFQLWCSLAWVAIMQGPGPGPGPGADSGAGAGASGADSGAGAGASGSDAGAGAGGSDAVAGAGAGASGADSGAGAGPGPGPGPGPDPSASVETPQSLVGINVIQARTMIAACEDLELLLSWFEGDERSTVRAAIEARITKLEEAAQ